MSSDVVGKSGRNPSRTETHRRSASCPVGSRSPQQKGGAPSPVEGSKYFNKQQSSSQPYTALPSPASPPTRARSVEKESKCSTRSGGSEDGSTSSTGSGSPPAWLAHAKPPRKRQLSVPSLLPPIPD